MKLNPQTPRRVVGVAGNQSLRVVVELNSCDADGSLGLLKTRPSDMVDKLRPLLREADLPLCLHHDLPAIRFERRHNHTTVRIEVLVLDGTPLEQKIAHLRELVRPLGLFLPA